MRNMNDYNTMYNYYSNMMNNTFANPDEGFIKGNMIANEYEPYKNYGYVIPIVTNEKEVLLEQIQIYSFAAHDLNLYLDLNPNDKEALALFYKYKRECIKLTNEYENRYGPINLEDNNLKESPWAWINEPWPWNE